MEYNEFEQIFKNREKEINIDVSDENIKRLYDYMKTLIDWNKKINLTAITDEKEIIEKHFIDSLTILNYIKDSDKVVDVGTGAGFPGVPLAINSAAKITLIDSLNKRINFLNEVRSKLNLDNVQNIHGRAEEIAREKQHRENYDVAVSRAVAPMNILAEYLLPFVKVGGICICMKGPNIEEEILDSKNAVELLGGEVIDQVNMKLNDGNISRSLIIIQKVKLTVDRYPRRPGVPEKQPL